MANDATLHRPLIEAGERENVAIDWRLKGLLKAMGGQYVGQDEIADRRRAILSATFDPADTFVVTSPGRRGLLAVVNLFRS